MNVSGRLFRRIEDAMAWLAGLSLFIMMMLVGVDVLMRYIFNRPLALVYDLVGHYLLPAVFFLAISCTNRTRGHIAVDLFKNRLSTVPRRLAEAFGALVGLVLFGTIGWLGLLRALDSFAHDERLLGAVAWHVWISDALVPIGCGVLVVRLVITIIGHVLSAVTGRSIIPEPPTDAEQENLE